MQYHCNSERPEQSSKVCFEFVLNNHNFGFHSLYLGPKISAKRAAFSISFDVIWIPRDDHTKVGYISMLVDYDDLPHKVNKFARVYDTKLRRVSSLFWYPETDAVQVFL